MAPKKKPAKKKAPPRKARSPKARSITSPVDVMAAIKRPMALDLRVKGRTFREIAGELGVSVETAHRYVMDGLGELAEQQHAKANDLRALEVARLDALLVKVWPFATGDLSGLIGELKAKHAEMLEADPKAAKKGPLAQLLAELMDGVPSDSFLKRALNIIQLRARLLGLEAPVKHAHTNPAGDEERPPGTFVFPVPPGVSVEDWQKLAASAAKAGQS